MNSLSLSLDSARPHRHLRDPAKERDASPATGAHRADPTPADASEALTSYYEHCLRVFMKADSLQQAADRQPSPSPMDRPSSSNRVPHGPGPQSASWMAAMAASTFPWPFIPQVIRASVSLLDTVCSRDTPTGAIRSVSCLVTDGELGLPAARF